jgi:hypothetical protein
MKTIKHYSYEEAKAIVNADFELSIDCDAFIADYESGDLDCGFEYGNFFNLIEDPSKVVIQWLDSTDTARELIVDSLEQALVIIRDIEEANGDIK